MLDLGSESIINWKLGTKKQRRRAFAGPLVHTFSVDSETFARRMIGHLQWKRLPVLKQITDTRKVPYNLISQSYDF